MDAAAYLTPWSSFFVMTGSSAAALTGLMFVVITLVTGTERVRRSHDGISTFSTPTVVHFCAALLVSAVLAAPWHALIWPSALLAVAGFVELLYIVRIGRRTASVTNYTPDVDDWTWYVIVPMIAYGTILGGGIALDFAPRGALFALAGGALLLTFMGIRNAWDVVTFLAIDNTP